MLVGICRVAGANISHTAWALRQLWKWACYWTSSLFANSFKFGSKQITLRTTVYFQPIIQQFTNTKVYDWKINIIPMAPAAIRIAACTRSPFGFGFAFCKPTWTQEMSFGINLSSVLCESMFVLQGKCLTTILVSMITRWSGQKTSKAGLGDKIRAVCLAVCTSLSISMYIWCPEVDGCLGVQSPHSVSTQN